MTKRMTQVDLIPQMEQLWTSSTRNEANMNQQNFTNEPAASIRPSFSIMIDIAFMKITDCFGLLIEFLAQLLFGFFLYINYKIIFFIFCYSKDISNKNK